MDTHNIEYFKEELKLVKNNKIFKFSEIDSIEHKCFLTMDNNNKEYPSIIKILNNNKIYNEL